MDKRIWLSQALPKKLGNTFQEAVEIVRLVLKK